MRPCHPAGYWTAAELAKLIGVEGRLVSCLLHAVAPAGWTARGSPAWALRDVLGLVRPDLARELAPVLRCRLAVAGPCSRRPYTGGEGPRPR